MYSKELTIHSLQKRGEYLRSKEVKLSSELNPSDEDFIDRVSGLNAVRFDIHKVKKKLNNLGSGKAENYTTGQMPVKASQDYFGHL